MVEKSNISKKDNHRLCALLVASENIYLTPFLRFYTKRLEDLDVQYNVLYWDKNDNEYISDSRYIRFANKGTDKLSKIIGFLRFRNEILKYCRKQKTDIIIPLQPIVSFIINVFLTSQYEGKYVFDIRDYSHERFGFFRRAEKRLAANSMINIISSEGYKNFLPNAEYFLTHNIPGVQCESYRQLENRNGSTVEISYIGLIRFMEQNEKIINFFKNDQRFHLNFIGTNAECLEAYCKENNVENVTLCGTFPPEETLEKYKDTDLIMNLYGNHIPLLDYALSNKLYFSALLYKPILVCEDTYMEKVSQEYQIGFTLPMKDPREKDALYEYITHLKRDQFILNCDHFIQDVISDIEKLDTELKLRIEKLKGNTK